MPRFVTYIFYARTISGDLALKWLEGGDEAYYTVSPSIHIQGE